MATTFDRPTKSPKYQNQGKIAGYLVNGFFNSIDMLLNEGVKNRPKRIIEIGAGEGHVSKHVLTTFPTAEMFVTDIFDERLALAKDLLGEQANINYRYEDILAIKAEDNYFDLVVCCEVLEHIDQYEEGLQEIFRVLKPGGILLTSVPREPLWRMLNMVRLKYLKDFGNTPTHVNHWSAGGFKKLLTKTGFNLLASRQPLPWTMILTEKPK